MANEPRVYGENGGNSRPNEEKAPLPDQIRAHFKERREIRAQIHALQDDLDAGREEAQLENHTEYMEAKNADQRAAVILAALEDNVQYQRNRAKLRRLESELELLVKDETPMYAMLVEAAKAPGENY